MTQPLPLSLLCTVSVTVSAQGVQVPTFNQGLIVGNSGRIPSQGANGRCRLYLSLSAMVADGFLTTDPEYIAASLYFGVDSAYPAPVYLWVGAQDPTAIAAAGLVFDTGHGGTGYAIGDTFSVIQGGATGAVGKVTGATAGVVTSVAIVEGQQGSGYADASNLATATLTGSGAGLEVNVTAIGETPLEAITACRLKAPAWYLAMSTTAVDADHLAIASYAQTAQPAMQYLYGTASASALTGAAGNIFSLIKAANYNRAHGVYSTTQGGAAPNNAYIAAAVMGLAMGLNTGNPGSAFTLAAKTLAGVTTEPLTPNQIAVFAGLPGQGTGNNGNVYGNFGNSYSWYEQGVNGNGTWFDLIMGLDMFAADAQLSVLNAVQVLGKVPQDDAGQSVILNAVSGAGSRAQARGFVASGIWQSNTLLSLSAGDPVPNGYLVQSAGFNTQSQSDRDARKGMPVIVALTTAGAQQSFSIGVNVQQ